MRFWGHRRYTPVVFAVLLIYVGWRAVVEERLALFLIGERHGDDAKRWGWILIAAGVATLAWTFRAAFRLG